MGQWRRFTVITWSDSNCNAPRTRRDAEGRLGAAARCAVRADSCAQIVRIWAKSCLTLVAAYGLCSRSESLSRGLASSHVSRPRDGPRCHALPQSGLGRCAAGPGVSMRSRGDRPRQPPENAGRGTHTFTKGACMLADGVLEGEGIWPPAGGPELPKGESWASLLKGITSRCATAMSVATAYGWGLPPTTTVTSCWPGMSPVAARTVWTCRVLTL